MKKIVSVVLLALMSAGAVQACVKKKTLTVNPSPLTIIVMDTTQALLPEVQVKAGKTTFTTSFDGRIVLKPEQLAGVKSFVFSCEGYKEQKVAVPEDGLLIVQLTPKPGSNRSINDRYYTLGGAKSGKMYYRTSVLASAAPESADVLYELDGASVAESKAERPHILPAYENNVSAGKLTAGEVNDFAKWSFWFKVLDGSHKQFIRTWQLEPRHCYTVQVVNKHGYPIVNYPVNLSDPNGNTLYQAITDNTGKAELWNGLTVNGERLAVSSEWKEGLNTIVIDEPCEASYGVDVLFVFDATGSMGDELRYLQAEMKDVIARAKEATGGLAIRTGAVVYRDHGDDYLTRISRLTEDLSTTQAFIDKQEANGGGDYPEAVPEALMAALNSAGWDSNARARIAFLILDAPCHEDSATLALLHDQILNAAAMGVRIVPVVCSGIGESGEFLMRSIALATNGTSFFLTDDSGIGHTHLKPATDSLKVEHLNDMLVRTIVEFSLIPNCEGRWEETVDQDEIEAFLPNPFDPKDLTPEELIEKDSRTTLYLLDVTGKLIYIYNGRLEDAGDSQLSHLPIALSTGVYFVKAFYDGEWHTEKILVH